MIDCGLTNRVVLVTGGSGGIGAAVCRAFARQGARVAVHHIAAEPAAPSGTQWEHITPPTSAAEALADELGGAAVAADLSAPDAARRLLDDVQKALGPVAVLVNNAAHGPGTAGRGRPRPLIVPKGTSAPERRQPRATRIDHEAVDPRCPAGAPGALMCACRACSAGGGRLSGDRDRCTVLGRPRTAAEHAPPSRSREAAMIRKDFRCPASSRLCSPPCFAARTCPRRSPSR